MKLEGKIKVVKSPKEAKELKCSLQKFQEREVEIHKTTWLDTFLQGIKDPNMYGNILDLINILSND